MFTCTKTYKKFHFMHEKKNDTQSIIYSQKPTSVILMSLAAILSVIMQWKKLHDDNKNSCEGN